jgi:site-specific recombinase XerD
MTKPRLRLVAPTTENRTVTPRRPRNGALRTREHLTIDEVERLIEAAKNNRYGHRDALMVLLAFRHGLRGIPTTHPLTGRELRALRRHQRESPKSPFVFVSERGAPLSAPGFSRMVERTAVGANLKIKAHAHMLGHGCGYKLANDGQDTRALQAYLGHKNIQNTTRYTALAQDRFKGFWRD